MELIVISDTKLKVILTEEEMESYGLIGEGEEEPPRTAVERLLADIRRLSGFDAVNARVLVQLWRDRSGGGGRNTVCDGGECCIRLTVSMP